MNNIFVAGAQTPGLPRQDTQAQFRQNMANAYAAGDPRFTVKQYDRPGFSRGRAQWNQAGIDAAQNLAKGVSDAYSNQMQAQAYNANTSLQSQASQEQFAQNLAALQQQNNYANQLAALQQQQAVYGMIGGLLKGLMD